METVSKSISCKVLPPENYDSYGEPRHPTFYQRGTRSYCNHQHPELMHAVQTVPTRKGPKLFTRILGTLSRLNTHKA